MGHFISSGVASPELKLSGGLSLFISSLAKSRPLCRSPYLASGWNGRLSSFIQMRTLARLCDFRDELPLRAADLSSCALDKVSGRCIFYDYWSYLIISHLRLLVAYAKQIRVRRPAGNPGVREPAALARHGPTRAPCC